MITKALEMGFELEREFRDLLELEVFRRIEIVGDVMGFIKIWRARMHWVQLNAGEVRQPGERRFFGGDDVILFFFTENYVLDPIRGPFWPILLVKGLALNPIGITNE